MSFGKRLKEIRQKLGMTQETFAKKIDVTQSAITNYELEKRQPPDAIVSFICREFKINKDWLLNGNGEMFIPDTDDELERLAERYDLSKSAKIVIKQFAKLPPAVQEEFISFFRNICAELSKDESETVEVTSSFTQEQIRQIMQQIPQDPAEFFKSKEKKNENADLG